MGEEAVIEEPVVEEAIVEEPVVVEEIAVEEPAVVEEAVIEQPEPDAETLAEEAVSPGFEVFLQEYLSQGKTKEDAELFWPYLSETSVAIYEEEAAQKSS